jgi:hypothetical protein
VATPPLGRAPEKATPPPPAPRPKSQAPRPLSNGPTLQHPQPRQASRLPLNLPPARTLSATAQPSYSPPPFHYQQGRTNGKVYSYVKDLPARTYLTATAPTPTSHIPVERREPTYVRIPSGNPCLYPHEQSPVATYPLRNNGYATYQTPVITYHGHYWNQEQLRWIPYILLAQSLVFSFLFSLLFSYIFLSYSRQETPESPWSPDDWDDDYIWTEPSYYYPPSERN